MTPILNMAWNASAKLRKFTEHFKITSEILDLLSEVCTHPKLKSTYVTDKRQILADLLNDVSEAFIDKQETKM